MYMGHAVWPKEADAGRAAQVCPLPKLPVPLGIGQLLARYLRMRVGVTNFFFQGRVRLSMHPLLNKMPVVGAIKVLPHFLIFWQPDLSNLLLSMPCRPALQPAQHLPADGWRAVYTEQCDKQLQALWHHWMLWHPSRVCTNQNCIWVGPRWRSWSRRTSRMGWSSRAATSHSCRAWSPGSTASSRTPCCSPTSCPTASWCRWRPAAGARCVFGVRVWGFCAALAVWVLTTLCGLHPTVSNSTHSLFPMRTSAPLCVCNVFEVFRGCCSCCKEISEKGLQCCTAVC